MAEENKNGRGRWILLGGGVLVIVAGFFVWRALAPRESTDDAQVSGHVSPVAPRVGGTVLSVDVAENQVVKAGDVLVRIDPRDYELAVARAEADLAVAEAASQAAHTDVPITSTSARSSQQVADVASSNAQAGLHATEQEIVAANAKLNSAKARLEEAHAHASKATQDLARLTPLAAKDEIPRQQFDAATADKRAADAAVATAEAGVHEAQANVSVSEARRTQAAGAVEQAKSQARAAATAPQQIAQIEARASGAEAQVKLARTALDAAKLNLERTIVHAPADGVVGKKSVEKGQVVQAGQPLMSVTALHDVWITANFKETQLKSMAVGQRADVEVDAYGRSASGRIESIAPATGSTFSLLPADNATGNFVKVVQRVPVKIVLDRPQDASTVLRPGMSVVATVYLR